MKIHNYQDAEDQLLDHPLGQQISEILSRFRGLHNAPVDWTHKANLFQDPHLVRVVWTHSIANWDDCDLTILWLECSQRGIRIEICPHSRTTILIHFSQREVGPGPMWRRIPTVEDLIAHCNVKVPALQEGSL